MSKSVSLLTGKPEPIVSQVIGELEKICGFPSEDVRFLAENGHRVAHKIASLGLDAHDTTGAELYHALLAKFEADSRHFARTIGLEKESADKRLDGIASLTGHVPVPEVWAIKPTAAKRLLRADPPKHLMKVMNYRSVESMLKREDTDEILAAISFTESKTWLNNFGRKKAQLGASDFYTRPARVLLMPSQHWARLAEHLPAVSKDDSAGVVAVWPSPNFSWRAGLSLFVLILKKIEELKVESNFVKLRQLSPLQRNLEIAGHPLVSWQSLHHFFSTRPAHEHPLEFEPLQAEDLRHNRAEAALAKVMPHGGWWNGRHAIHLHDDQAVSLNLNDTVLNKLANRNFNKRYCQYGQVEFWDELVGRYMKYPAFQSRLLGQIDRLGQEIEPDFSFSKLEPQLVEA